MPTFTVSDWKAAFKLQLEGRSNLSGVTIYDANQTLPDTDRESIILGDWEAATSHLTFGVDEEATTVTGSIRILKPDAAKTARDRAMALLTEVKDAIDGDFGGSDTVFDSQFTNYTAEENIWPEGGRVCKLEFEIYLEAHS